MVGTVGDMAQALATLQHEQTRLIGLLQGEPAWHAWQQLDARESNDDPVNAIDSRALRERLATRLDAAVPGWRALAGIEAALAALAATPAKTQLPAPVSRAITEPQSPPATNAIATVGVPELQARFAPPATDQVLGSAAEARNRSLTQAIGTMYAVDAREAAPLTAAAAAEPPADRSHVDARAVLGRIRSVDGERRAIVPDASIARREVTPPPLPKSVAIAGTPPARSDPGTTRALDSRPPAAIAKAAPLPPPLHTAARPVVPEPQPEPEPEPQLVPSPAALQETPAASSSAHGPAKPSDHSSSLDGAARVAALEQELERLMQRNIEARRQQRPPPPRPAPLASLSNADDLGDNLDEIFLDEAEIEIVPLAVGTQPDDAGDHEDAPGPLSLRLRQSLSRHTTEAGSYAAYRGIIDEASVEIVQLEDAGSATTPDTTAGPARPPPQRLVRSD